MTATISPATNFPETFTRKEADVHILKMAKSHTTKVGNVDALVTNTVIVGVINATNHAINFYKPEDSFSDGRKNIIKEGAKPYYTLPAGVSLNVQYETEKSDVFGFQLTTRKIVSVDIPQSFNGADIVICSAQYSQAINAIKHNTEAHDVLFLGVDTLYYKEGGIAGAVGFIAQ